MPFNPRNSRSIARLQEAIEQSRKQLKPFRETRQSLIEMYAGANYGDYNELGPSLVNMVELAVNIYQRLLASNSPSVMVDTAKQEYLAVAHELELVVNHVIQRQIFLGEALNDVVYDSLFGWGIMKVGITPREHDDLEGFRHDAGTVYADPIGLEDWVHDINAKRIEQCEFFGNRYRVPLESVLESPLFSKKAKAQLESLGGMRDSAAFDDSDWEDPSDLSGGRQFHDVELRDHIWLWDVWLPYDQVLVTIVHDKIDRPLRIVDWEGPENGPYHFLGYGKVPGNVMPLPPAFLWEDIADVVSRIAQKVAFQAENQKTILVGTNRAKNALEAIIQSTHGDALTVDVDPSQVREINFNGIDGNMLAGLGQFRQLFSYIAGNIDSLGGLSPQSSTLGQDKLLSQAASERLADMQERVVQFTERVVRDIAWYIWDDPLIEVPLKKQLTENIEVDFVWDADSRQGKFFDYTFKIAPYSLRSMSPQERLNFIMQITSQVIIPMAPMLAQSGLQFDVRQFLKLVGRLANTTDIENLVIDTMPEENTGGDSMAKPQSTVRKYVREDRPSNKAMGDDPDKLLQKALQTATPANSGQSA